MLRISRVTGRLLQQLALLTGLAVTGNPIHAAVDAEDAFRSAREWTVRVRFPTLADTVDRSLPPEGTGFVVDAVRGWIMTNAHVAGWWPTDLHIAFSDGRLIPAKTVYVDPHLDLAIISYMPAQRRQPPPTATLECQTVPSVGHPVGTFGHPRGHRFSGTRGIVSAVTTRPGTEMLQTDAPANDGNSGGPLLSLKTGRVVGIVTTKSTGENVEGLVFAIPMPYACTILRLLQARRDASPPGSSIHFAIEENQERGLLVARNGLPATTLDLRIGDTVITAKGRAVANPTQLYDALRGSLDSVALTVRRDGKDVRVTGKWPVAPLITEREGFWLDGALIAPAEDALGGLSAVGERLMVHHVAPASEAEAVDLREFDLVERVNGQPVGTLKDLDEMVRKSAGSERGVELMLLRRTEEGPALFEHHRRRLSGGDVGLSRDGG